MYGAGAAPDPGLTMNLGTQASKRQQPELPTGSTGQGRWEKALGKDI